MSHAWIGMIYMNEEQYAEKVKRRGTSIIVRLNVGRED